MGVLYEHWRPDKNECFYVGISWAAEDTRPYDLTPRNKHYKRIVNKLHLLGLHPEIKIQADLNWITKKELCELETAQIKYWRNLIGKNLTNIAPGGEGVREWTLEMREDLKKTLQKPEVIAKRAAYWTKENRLKVSVRTKKKFENENERENHSLKIKISLSNPETKIKLQAAHLNNWNNPYRKEQARLRMSGEKNISKDEQIKLKKLKTRELNGPEFYKLSNETKKKIGVKNSFCMKAKGDLIHTKKDSVRAKNSMSRLKRWQDPASRGRYMFHWWWIKNAHYQNFWGS